MEYLPKRELQWYLDEFDKIAQELKTTLGSEWDFEYDLVGSASRNLVIKGNEGYDFDFHFLLKRYPNVSAFWIKEKVKQALNPIMRRHEMSFCEDSTHVLTSNHYKNSQLVYSYDIALLRKGQNLQILKKNKVTGHHSDYHFVDVRSASTFASNYKKINGPEMWNYLRERYLKKKEDQQYISKDDRTLSFSLLLVAVNDTLQEFNIR